MRGARLWAVLAVVVLLVLGVGMQMKAESKPSDFFLGEALVGSVGAAAGGGVAALATWLALKACPTNANDYRCGISVLLLGGMLGVLGIAEGAAVGVEIVGSHYGVSGNLGAAPVLAGIGALVSPYLSFWLFSTLHLPSGLWGPTVVLAICIGAGVGAAFGYNLGATMKSDKSKPSGLSWQLPLVEWKF